MTWTVHLVSHFHCCGRPGHGSWLSWCHYTTELDDLHTASSVCCIDWSTLRCSCWWWWYCVVKATPSTPLIEALSTFVTRRVSALPLVDNNRQLVDVYTKHDVMVTISDDCSVRLSLIDVVGGPFTQPSHSASHSLQIIIITIRKQTLR